MSEVPEDQVRDLERGADEMEEGLDRLEGEIETAQARAAEQRERADPEAVGGDWEDESAGAQQGDDPKDAEGREGPSGEAPVHEAERVEPGGEGGGDAPVHEAERVEPSGGGGGDDEADRSDDDAGPSAAGDDDFVA